MSRGKGELRSANPWYRVYVMAVVVAGIALLVDLQGGRVGFQDYVSSPSSLILWMAMISVAALSPIPLPRGSATASLAPAFDLAAILVFGPAVACCMGVFSRLVSHATEKWNPLLPGIMKLGQILLAIGVAGIVYVGLGGRTGGEWMLAVDGWLPLVAACASYLAVKTVVGALDAVLGAQRAAGHAGLLYVREVLAADLVVLPFGLLLALTQIRIGVVGTALFLVPLLLARYFYKHWVDTKTAHLDMVRTLMTAVDAADPHTRGHSYRISKMCLRVGRHLGMPGRDLQELEFAALLHDIGRTAIRRDVLFKPGRLTHQEQTLLRTHPKIGHDILSRLRFFRGAAEIVYAHHEQPDGKGYPRGLEGEEIPLGSRIIMAVSAFDAMTSDRPYRRGLAPETAFEELESHAGTQFFPDVVEALIHLHRVGKLFDELSSEELDRYARGEGNSRALEGFLEGKPAPAQVPEKRDRAGQERSEPDGVVPIIEFPSAEVTMATAHKTIPLKAKGRWKLVAAGRSDIGCRRQNNEDAFGIFENDPGSRGCLLVLADGMGGAAAGEVASRLAVETVSATYAEREGGAARNALERAIRLANQAIRERARSQADLDGMGTTLTAVCFVGRDVILGHVGDSRAYLVKPGSIEQLSQDHTLAAELARLGSNGGSSPAASKVLSRCLGSRPDVEVDVSPRPVTLDDGFAIVLCSDGLSDMVEPEEILETVKSATPDEACRELIELARSRGGPDNITVVVGKVQRA